MLDPVDTSWLDNPTSMEDETGILVKVMTRKKSKTTTRVNHVIEDSDLKVHPSFIQRMSLTSHRSSDQSAVLKLMYRKRRGAHGQRNRETNTMELDDPPVESLLQAIPR